MSASEASSLKKETPPVIRPGAFLHTYDPNKIYFGFSKCQGGIKNNFGLAGKYRERLAALPQRGGGLNTALIGVCDIAVKAGIPDPELESDLRASGRAFRPGEIERAIQRAHRFVHGGSPSAGRRAVAETPGCRLGILLRNKDVDSKSADLQKRLIARGGGSIDPFGADLWEASNPHPGAFPPIKAMPGSECCADMHTFLSLFRPDDFLYIGSEMLGKAGQREHIQTADQWETFFAGELDSICRDGDPERQRNRLTWLGSNYSHVIPNPLTGKPDENGSYRSEACVREYRFVIAEIDHDPFSLDAAGNPLPMPLGKQIALICGLGLPVAALTYSGGKSVHALVDVAKLNGGRPVRDAESWNAVVKRNLFGQLAPLGFDPAMSRPGQLSRLPGVWRSDKGRFQSLLYINWKRTPICLN